MSSTTWQEKLKVMIPSFGVSLNENVDLLNEIRNMAEFEASRTRNEAEGYKMERDITGQQINLERDKYRASLEKLVMELERKKNLVMYEVIKTEILEKI